MGGIGVWFHIDRFDNHGTGRVINTIESNKWCIHATVGRKSKLPLLTETSPSQESEEGESQPAAAAVTAVATRRRTRSMIQV
jgi:hypothetical protein